MFQYGLRVCCVKRFTLQAAFVSGRWLLSGALCIPAGDPFLGAVVRKHRFDMIVGCMSYCREHAHFVFHQPDSPIN